MAKEALNKHIKRCQKEYKHAFVPVVVSAAIDVNGIDTARALWGSSRDSHMKVMFTRLDKTTSTCQLVIYEIATDQYERMAVSLAHKITRFIEDLGLWWTLLMELGTKDYARSDQHGAIQGDQAYENLRSPPDWNSEVTVMIEVGWTQNLCGETRGL